jgi:protein-tyrosine-phosphatase
VAQQLLTSPQIGTVMIPATNDGREALLQAEQSSGASDSFARNRQTVGGSAPPSQPAGKPSAGKRIQNFIKQLVPAAVVAGLRVAAELKPVSPSGYTRLASVASAWRRTGQKPVLSERVSSVVFVCHGNIMRSPVSEAMLRNNLEKRGITNVKVVSAGMHAIAGRSADPRAQIVAPEFGVSVNAHRAQLLTQQLVDSNDLVIVMDIQNAAEFLMRFPQASDKLFTLRQFSERKRAAGRDIPDPYPGDEDYMRQCCGMLQECIEGLAVELAKAKK